MAVPKIKATYSLDVETAQALEETARRWKVSKSEALRRAIWAVAREGEARGNALSALEELQDSVALSAEAANTWQAQVGHERQAFDAGRERNGT